MPANEPLQKTKYGKIFVKIFGWGIRAFITVVFFLFFLLSMFPLVGNTIGWVMLGFAIVLFLLLFLSPLSTTVNNMLYLKTWFRYALYAVLIGLVAFAGCNMESKKRLKKFIQKNQLQKIEMNNLLQKGNP